MKALICTPLFILLFALAGCDSGKSNGSAQGQSSSSSLSNQFTLSGTVTAAQFSGVDSDTNDSAAPAATNNIAQNAQPLGNPRVLGGFASAIGTGEDGQRFSNSADSDDWFSVSASQGQRFDLQIHRFNAEQPLANDLDLYLYSPDDTANPIASSTGTSASESLAVAESGDYLLRVHARAGISNYTLKLDANNGAAAGPSVGQEFAPGEILVQWKSRPEQQQLDANGLQQIGGELAEKLYAYRLLGNDEATASIIVTLESAHLGASEQSLDKLRTLATIKQLQASGQVEWAEPNYFYRDALTPNDKHNHLQWHYRQIRLPQAWDITTGSEDVTVAVLDSGIFRGHPDFDGKLISGYDFISDPQNAGDGDGIDPNPEDPGDKALQNRSSWHGTHVAGTVGALTDNGTGVSGAGWNTRIMPLRVLGSAGGSSADIAQAVLYAAGLKNNSGSVPAKRADIINMSFGGSGFSETLQAAINDARAAGVLVVAAAGNNNSSSAYYPAAMDGVIAVSASDFNNRRAPYSNFGDWIDLAAPGGDMGVDANGDGYGDGVMSTHVQEGTALTANYSFLQGTSMASPHAAAVFALMKAVNGSLTPENFDALLAQGKLTKDIGDAGEDHFFGQGLIDAYKAVQAATDSVTVPVLVAEPDSLNFGNTQTSLEVEIKNIGAEGAHISGTPAAAASWISNVKALQTDSNGFGRYRISISRTQLADGIYSSDITFPAEGSADLKVRANLQVGGSDGEANAGYLYILLLKPGEDSDGDGAADLQVVAQLAKLPGEGSYRFEFTAVAAGDYLIAAGSDIDGNGFICDPGEACGRFPAADYSSSLQVDKNLSGLDFVASYGSGIRESGAENSQARAPSPGPLRLLRPSPPGK